MPTVRNLTAVDMNLGRIGRVVEAHGEAELSDDEAALVAGHPYLEVIEPKKSAKAEVKKEN